jgi:1,4-alpha-glucan branching enzyme
MVRKEEHMTHLLNLKKNHFVLWRPGHSQTPALVIGKLQPGNPSTLVNQCTINLVQHPGFHELWMLSADNPTVGLQNGETYHYFFLVHDTNPYWSTPCDIMITDPTALAVDWRLRAPLPAAGYPEDDCGPAAVVSFLDGELIACDAGGETPDWANDSDMISGLPPNNRCVIYEIPTSWSREGEKGGKLVDVGTFQDVLALVEVSATPANFRGVAALEGRAHLQELGVNVLELNPPADSFVDRQWGYATSNYLAADWDLGRPAGNTWSTATASLSELVKACHHQGIRFFVDMAMGFSNHDSLRHLNFTDFHVRETTDPAQEDPEKDDRQNWGGDLFKYGYRVTGYDPMSGTMREIVPAREFMKTQLAHWINFYHIDGVRIDSVKTVHNWDFIQEFTATGRALWKTRCAGQGTPAAEADARFIVVAEVLDDQQELELVVKQRRTDGIWNEPFKRRVRHAILGQQYPGDISFEETVRKLIDCRNTGYEHGHQVVNYLGSHDVEGFENERLYDFLENTQVCEKEQRFKLGFVCLLTAVGIPMIFAGDEFADKHDLVTRHPDKQMDAVNFERLEIPWRRRVFEYVARLVKLRTSHPALGVDETAFLHVDFSEGKRVLAWRRGMEGSGDQIVVVANFSAWETHDPFNGTSEYVVHNWPTTPTGKRWREVTQERDVPSQWVGREPLFPWEAKVYALV